MKPFSKLGLALLTMALLTVFVYAALMGAPYLYLDDPQNIFENPYLTIGPWWLLLKGPYFGMYIPVTSTAWAALFYLGAESTDAFHVFNIALHVANTVLAAILARFLLNRESGAQPFAVFAAAALFALHPLQVGAVAWISGGRDLLSAFFALLAVLTLFSRERRSWFALATVLFALSLFSKPQSVALPLAVFAAGVLTSLRKPKTLAIQMGLWSALSLVAAFVTASAQEGFVSESSPLWQRPLLMIDSLAFYLRKILWPTALSADYGRSAVELTSDIGMIAINFAVLALAAALTAWGARRHRSYAVLIAWPLLLLPVSGVVDFGYQKISTVADHYNYLALAPIALVFGQLVSDLASGSARRKWATRIATVVIVICWTVASHWRTWTWTSNEALFAGMLRTNPRSWVALTNLAHLSCVKGNDVDAGLEYSRMAIKIAPLNIASHSNHGACLAKAGHFGELAELETLFRESRSREMIERNSLSAADILNLLSLANLALGRPERSLKLSCQALAINPIAIPYHKQLRNVIETLHASKRASTCPPKLDWTTFASSLDSPL